VYRIRVEDIDFSATTVSWEYRPRTLTMRQSHSTTKEREGNQVLDEGHSLRLLGSAKNGGSVVVR
jgi:hypothetical protein